MNGIAGTVEKQDKPEFKVISDLVARLDQKEPAMAVVVDGEKVTVTKGTDSIITNK